MVARLVLVLVALALSLQVTSGQDLEGCGVAKGCFIQSCGNECMAFVTWETTASGRTKFSMRAERTAGLAWVAVGLRPSTQTSGMSPADVYACTSGSIEVQRSENVVAGGLNSETRTIPANNVTTESISSNNNVINCIFTREPSLEGDDKFYNISGDNAYYILLAVGDNINSDGTIAGNRHKERWQSSETMQLQRDFPMATVPPMETQTPAQGLDGCGKTIGCYTPDAGCGAGDCVAYVMYGMLADGRVRFTLRGQRSAGIAWVAVGLRPSTTLLGMSPADVYACTKGSGEVERSENVAAGGLNSETRTKPSGAVTMESIVVQNDMITCTFTRQATMTGDNTFYDISSGNTYYLLLAIGSNVNADGTIQGHQHTNRWPSSEAMQLQRDFPMATVPPMGTEPPMETQTPAQGLDGCGKTIGCYTPDAGCGAGDCVSYVMYGMLADGRVRFTLRGQRSAGIAWVAVGLRPSTTLSGMSPADVYACTKGSGEVERSENVAAGVLNSETRTKPSGAVTMESIVVQNDMITCTFTRQATMTGDNTFYDISSGNTYYLLLAIGSNVNADGTIQGNQHTNRWAADEAEDLNEFNTASGGSQNIALAKAHASLMVIAWVGFASIGITMARYFKPMWPSSKLLGQKVWFTIHRMCMVTCVCCFIAAFVLIFIYRGGFVSTAVKKTLAHAICGIIVTALGIINPIMGIFRPHPGTKNRPIFNWAHWGVGTTAHVLAIVTIFLGFGYDSPLLMGLPKVVFFIMIGFAVFHTVASIVFQVQLCMTQNKVVGPEPDAQPHPEEPDRSNDIPMRSAGGADSTQQLATRDPEPAGATAKSVLLSIYILCILAFVAVFIIFIAIN